MKAKIPSRIKTATHSRRALTRYFEKETERLERAIAQQQELIKTPGATRGELLDEATEVTEQAQSIGLLEELREHLAQVNAARQRLLEGQYGICKNCGRPISPARLQVIPYATLCVRCHTLLGPRGETRGA